MRSQRIESAHPAVAHGDESVGQRLDLNTVKVQVPPGVLAESPLLEGALDLKRVSVGETTVILAQLQSGEDALFIDGQQIRLRPGDITPRDAMRTISWCSMDREKLDHIDAYRSLNLRPAAEPNPDVVQAFAERRLPEVGSRAIMRNDDSSAHIYFDDRLGSEIPRGYYAKDIEEGGSRWVGPYQTLHGAQNGDPYDLIIGGKNGLERELEVYQKALGRIAGAGMSMFLDKTEMIEGLKGIATRALASGRAIRG